MINFHDAQHGRCRLHAAPTATLTLLDADILALTAAKRNVKRGVMVLSNCFSGVQAVPAFDWIVSNPPVHTGEQNNLDILEALLKGPPPPPPHTNLLSAVHPVPRLPRCAVLCPAVCGNLGSF